MRPRYKVRIKNTSGILQAESDKFESIAIHHILNAPGYCQLSLQGDHEAIEYFERDAIIEVWRSVEDLGLDWYREWEGFHRTEVGQTFENGRKNFTSYSKGFADLLQRRIIAYPSGDSHATKEAPAETVMKEFVDENAGPGATSPPRIRDGVTQGLLVDTDAAGGSTWYGARSYRNLLETLQEVSDETNMFFDVVSFETINFLFKTYDGVRGTDRRHYNIDPNTGLNGAGNEVAVFSLPLGNVEEIVLSHNADDQITAVFALGQGEEDARSVVYVTNNDAIDESPWNLRELARNATSEATEDGLTAVANAELEKRGAITTFNFAVQQTEGYFYGRHYYFGDYVTGRYGDFEADKYIIGANITVNEKGEDILISLADVP